MFEDDRLKVEVDWDEDPGEQARKQSNEWLIQ